MSKYVITGSLGHISKPIVEGLVKAGHQVTVITSTADRAGEIQQLGATALVGKLEEASFVEKAFQHADVVYTMIPPIWQTNDWRASQNVIAKNYFNALKASAVKYVVNLSSIGADVGNGVGPVDGMYDMEQLLNQLSIPVKHLRPSYFYYNLLAQIGMAKQAGILGSNFGEGEKLFLVHPRDIAAAALEELLGLTFTGKSVRYIIDDERSGSEIATVLGKAIGKDLNWVVFTDEQQKQGLLQAGLPETHAEAYTQMGTSLRSGIMQRDARKNLPTFGPTKLEEFAKEFAQAYKA